MMEQSQANMENLTPFSQEPRKLPHIENYQQGPVDAVIVLGMGPVRPQLRGVPNEEGVRRPIADFERMRAIAIATKELAAHGEISPKGFIIPTGRASANSGDVQKAAKYREEKLTGMEDLGAEQQKAQLYKEANERGEKVPGGVVVQRFYGLPQSEKEVEKVVQISEARLMTDLINLTRPKKKGDLETKQRILEEKSAPNTIRNFVESINELDKVVGEVWKGSLGIVTSNFGHISRGEEILHALGFTRENGYVVIGLSAERVLRHYGYSESYLDRYESQNAPDGTIQNQEKFRRAVRTLPLYLLPEVGHFENDDRLLQVMHGVRQWYGEEALKQFNLDKFETLSASEIRARLPKDSDRVQPPDDWKKETDIALWREEIAAYDQVTEAWLTRNEKEREAK